MTIHNDQACILGLIALLFFSMLTIMSAGAEEVEGDGWYDTGVPVQYLMERYDD